MYIPRFVFQEALRNVFHLVRYGALCDYFIQADDLLKSENELYGKDDNLRPTKTVRVYPAVTGSGSIAC